MAEEYTGISFNRLYSPEVRGINGLLEAVGYAIASDQDINEAAVDYLNKGQALSSLNIEQYYSKGKKLGWVIPREYTPTYRVHTNLPLLKENIAQEAGLPVEELSNVSLGIETANNLNTPSMAYMNDFLNYTPISGTVSSSILLSQIDRHTDTGWRETIEEIYGVPTLNNPSVGDSGLYLAKILSASFRSTQERYYDSYSGDEVVHHINAIYMQVEYIHKATGYSHVSFARIKRIPALSRRIGIAVFRYRDTYYQWLLPSTDTLFPPYTTEFLGNDSALEFYPWMVIARDAIYTNSTGEADKEVKELGATIGIDPSAIGSALRSASSAINDAVIYPTIDLLSKSEEALEYLFDYFMDYYPSKNNLIPLPNTIKLNPTWKNSSTSFYVSEFTFSSIAVSEVEFLGATNRGDFHISTSYTGPLHSTFAAGEYYLYKRKNGTTFTRVAVSNPVYRAYIAGGESEFATVVHIQKGLSESSDISHVRMAVARNRLNLYPSKVRELIFIEALGLEVTTYEKVDTKWYSSPIFTLVLYAVAVVLTVFTLDLSGTWIQIATSIVVAIGTNLAVGYVLKLIIEKVSGDTGIALAIIAAALLRYGSNLAATLSQVSVEVALALTNIVLSVADLVLAQRVDLLQKEQEDFNEMLTGKRAELEEAYSLLENPLDKINSFYEGLSNRDVIVVESPTEFFFRTVHAGNVGANTLDLATNFTNEMLNLDNISELDTKYLLV